MRRKFWIDSIDLWSSPLFAEMGLFVCFRLALTTNQNSVFCCGTISLSFRSCSFICSSVTLSTSVVLNLFLGSDTFWELAIHLSIQTIDKSQITRIKMLNRRFRHTRTAIQKSAPRTTGGPRYELKWSAIPHKNQYFVLRGALKYFKWSAFQKSLGTTALEDTFVCRHTMVEKHCSTSRCRPFCLKK